MQDRRDEYKDVPWQQCLLLYTRQVARMSAEWKQEANAAEKRLLFAHFTPHDEGRSRVLLWRFDSAQECAEAVIEHNRLLVERVKKGSAST